MIYIALILVGVIPVLFTLILPKKEQFFSNKIVKGFGLGVYAGLIYILLSESFEHINNSTDIYLPVVVFVIGVLISLLINFYFKEFHHHHEHIEGKHDHEHTKNSAVKIIVSDFFHNIVDGIAIVSGFAIGASSGFLALFGVLGHQIIQQTGQQILLVEEGLKPKSAIGVSFLISLSVFIALILGDNHIIEIILMSFSAGIIFFKILNDIIETKWIKANIFGFIVGILLIVGILFLVPHMH